CYIVLCYIVLCYIVICVLHCVTLCYIVLYCVILCYIVLIPLLYLPYLVYPRSDHVRSAPNGELPQRVSGGFTAGDHIPPLLHLPAHV
ncbi:hypothetical protein B484DRAFT_337778, partial [Ochromonadaceae sp. CCMP2298]